MDAWVGRRSATGTPTAWRGRHAQAARGRVRTRGDPRLRHLQRPGGPGPPGAAAGDRGAELISPGQYGDEPGRGPGTSATAPSARWTPPGPPPRYPITPGWCRSSTSSSRTAACGSPANWSARPLAALLVDKPLGHYRAAEVASDVLIALRVLHAYGWTHRNVTASTVLVCDDGRAMLAGLAAGAAQEALCGYDPVPAEVMAGGNAAGPGRTPSALEQERARQARITVVGPVTERWAPEQATPVHENWQLAPPVGPAADLWALGSLLFRSVQGHPPFPEESTAGARSAGLRGTARLRRGERTAAARRRVAAAPRSRGAPGLRRTGGWLRSLIRSAPEPDLGLRTVPVPTDPRKLPIVRRRGELVRRRRSAAAAAAEPLSGTTHRRHARAKQERPARQVNQEQQTRTRGPKQQSELPRAAWAPGCSSSCCSCWSRWWCTRW